jgi:arabinan endo-1,5-alpha-L-arabinosidase
MRHAPSRGTGASRLRLAACVALLALLTACGSAGAPPENPQSSGGSDEGLEPVIDSDFPDPDVLSVDGTYYAYATNGNAKNVQVAQSDDLETWEELPEDALPELASWIIPGKTWAPEVTELSSGSYVMYFTATNFRPSVQCIGVATATEPTGPFEVQGDGMLVCPADEGGAIDASTFAEDGTLYLVWKNDGNCCGLDTWISMAPLSPDGLSLAGPGERMIKQTLDWEGDLVEAPTLVKRDDTYYLFYSSNSYGDERYAVGYATSPALAGPWIKSESPFLASGEDGSDVRGPGGQDIVRVGTDEDWLVFHAWDPGFTYRGMFVAPMRWESSGPDVILAAQ